MSPGETDADFEESRAFMESMPFTYLHVFTYSERPGTPAAESAQQVPMPVRKERNRVLRELAVPREANRLVDLRIGAVTEAGLREAASGLNSGDPWRIIQR